MKATKLLVAGVAIMSVGFGLSGRVDAADAKVSTAEVTITAGNLVLETVPDLKFETVSVADIAAATTPVSVGLESGELSGSASPNGDENLTTTVGDYRGTTSTGWSLSAELSPFVRSGGAEQFLGTMNLVPTASGFNGTIHGTPPTNSIEIGDASTLIATADPGEGLGTNEFVFSAGASSPNTLTIPQQSDIMEGIYQAAMTWTLSATP